jgi:hypothetical protein
MVEAIPPLPYNVFMALFFLIKQRDNFDRGSIPGGSNRFFSSL